MPSAGPTESGEPIWLFRGVPAESPEVADVRVAGEIEPSRPDRRGEIWRQYHMAGATETAYTSWTDDRSIAVDSAEYAASGAGLSGRIVVLRVRCDSVDPSRLFEGRADEFEYLIEGTVEGIEVSEGNDEDDA